MKVISFILAVTKCLTDYLRKEGGKEERKEDSWLQETPVCLPCYN